MFNQELGALSRLLEVSSLRHQVICNNLANLNTPGFQRKQVEFETILDKASLGESVRQTTPRIVTESDNGRLDDNSVVLEQEVQSLNSNNLMHQVYWQAMSSKIKGLEAAITGKVM